MSGHNKWSKIKRDKASNDAKKGTAFTKLGNQIALAAKNGVDPQTNSALALAIETAKSFNMPTSTIERAIARAKNKQAAALEEVLYEGYGPGGVALLIACATDNRKRTYPEVKATLTKNGGSIADPGAVVFNFQQVGEILLKTQADDELVLQILEAGAQDVIEDDDYLIVITKPADLHSVVLKIKALNLLIEQAALSYIPKVTLDLDNKAQQKIEKLIQTLNDLDDTINVYSNLQ